MTPISEFVVDQYYDNQDIYKSLGIQNLGGIRPKLSDGKLQFVVVTTSSEGVNITFARKPYADRLEGDLLIYVATGLYGHQSITGANKRIVEQYDRSFPIFGFINEGSQKGRRFLGLLELLRHYQEMQHDGKHKLRRAWVFEFRVHPQPTVVPLELADQISRSVIEDSRRRTADEERGEVKLAEVGPLWSAGKKQEATPIRVEEIRSKLLRVNPYAFEELVKDTIERNGFYRVTVTKRSGDGGVDVNGYLDSSHFFARDILVQFQAKRWQHSVGRREVAELRGSLEAPFGVMITTSHYTAQATQEAEQGGRKPVILVDGPRFSEIVAELKVPLDKYVKA